MIQMSSNLIASDGYFQSLSGIGELEGEHGGEERQVDN